MSGNHAFAAEVATARIDSVGIPSGFTELAREHEIVTDVYFGGRKIGDARVLVRPGFVRFRDPANLLALVPNVEASAALASAVAGDVPSNVQLACPRGTTKDCGSLSPEIFGVILDEDQFRLDVFVNPRFLRLIAEHRHLYLSTPTAPLSLTSSTGLALSGSNQSSTLYNIQNRTIVGFRNARIRTQSAFASKYGFVVDTLAGELDRPGVRYTAGLFWAPGLDLIGRRRIAGVGIATQFDTRTDRDSLIGTPLVLFLAQASRVDFLVDGRLVDSRSYEAGNNILDTSNLPNGSYPIVLRIHEANGTVREEQRFFAKNTQIAPLGHPIYFAYAGLLANNRRHQPISVSDRLFYQLGVARRLNNALALDASVIGTGANPIFEAGAWLVTPIARVRVAGLLSPAGDHGALVQLASANNGRLRVDFDLRRVWSHDGKPLIPVSSYVDTFNAVPLTGVESATGSYTQASASIGYRFGAAYLAVIGSLRKQSGAPADYSVGPNLSWPMVNVNQFHLALDADAQLTRTTTAGYVGIRMFFTSRRFSLSSTAGARTVASRHNDGPSSSRAVGDTTLHASYSNGSGTDVSLAGGVARDLHSTTAHVEAFAYSHLGSARGEVLHDFEGSNRTQYGLSIQTGAVLNRNDALFGGRDLAESGLVISLDGAGDSQFEVLINGQPRGRVSVGSKLPIFLEPYRAYSVALRPVDAASVSYDTASRQFTLFPGNVEHAQWHVDNLVTVFGRAVGADGKPVADAMISSRRGIGQSDANGYFQIETTANDRLSFDRGNGNRCEVSMEGLSRESGLQVLGEGRLQMKWISATALVAAMLVADFAAAPSAARAELVLSQLVVDLSPGDQSRSDLEVWNNGKERSFVSVEPREVIAPGTASESRSADPDPEKLGILVSPNRLILEPGERRLIRIAAIAPPSGHERVYRVTVKPVMGKLSSERSGLKVLVGYDVLVLLRPDVLKPHVSASRSADQLTLRNDGNMSLELVDGERCERATNVCQSLPSKQLYSGAATQVAATATQTVRYKAKAGTKVLPLEF